MRHCHISFFCLPSQSDCPDSTGLLWQELRPELKCGIGVCTGIRKRLIPDIRLKQLPRKFRKAAQLVPLCSKMLHLLRWLLLPQSAVCAQCFNV